jgi:SSS family solute:Na+ symporter
MVALVANLLVCVVATFLFRALKVADGTDVTQNAEYFADQDDPRLRDLQEVVQ